MLHLVSCAICDDPAPCDELTADGRCAACYVDLVYDLVRLEGSAGPYSTPWFPL